MSRQVRKILHIYHGDGKGKTTASIGIAIRAKGAGLKVCFVQFLKKGSSSEVNILKNIDGIEYICCEKCNKFVFQMTDTEKAFLISEYNKILEKIFSDNADVIILDEFLDAYNLNMISKKSAENHILHLDKEIILTGRNPAEIFTDNADYISEIKAIRHPYNKGISARKGIEF